MIKKIRIPENRFAVVIGRRGATKREIEKKLDVRMTMGEDVTIEGEAVAVMDAENIVRAIGRGFSPECAILLANEEYTFSVIQLPKDERTLIRLRSRIIGAGGKARRNIERLTETHVCVFGKTVSIIGRYENADLARKAIEKLIEGFSHRSVYAFLEKEKKELGMEREISLKEH
jgi:ribosomal RNA assembly protein